MFMNYGKFSRPLITHVVAVVFGFVIAFGSIQVSSSQAEPAPVLAQASDQPVKVTDSKPSATAVPQSFVAAAVERTGSAVVRIDTQKTVTRTNQPLMDDPFFQEFFGNRIPQQMPQSQRITGQGSGFIVDKAGVILTNAHVVSGAEKVTVTLKDGRTFEGVVKGTDEVTDLAIVKVNTQGKDLPVAVLGDSSQVKVGDWAIAVGNPVGLNNTVTLGIISTLERSSAQAGIPDKRVEFLQTDAAINPGNSGGPLLNANGEVIGINTAIRADAMGIGFAIPINKVKSLEKYLADGKQVPHPYIGIQMVNVSAELAKLNNQDANAPFIIPEVDGILVVRVLPGTPAEAAGIRRGDVILKANNKPVEDGGQLQSLVDGAGLDQEIPLTIQRGDKQINLKVRTAQMKPTLPQ